MVFALKSALRLALAAVTLALVTETAQAETCIDASVPSSTPATTTVTTVPVSTTPAPSSQVPGSSSSGEGSSNGTTMCFSPDFLFGTATAAQQVEGGYNATGRTVSLWDSLCRTTSSIECSNVADDFVHRYTSDIQLMKNDGYGAFRMSLSWPRVMNWNATTGRMQANPEGIAFYHSVIDEILANGIVPFVTIFHWDTPIELFSLGDFLNASMIDHFVDYTDLVLKEFGQKVQHWATINEPHSYMSILYIRQGTDSDEYEAAHNMILAHAHAVQRFRELKADGTVMADADIGIVLSGFGVTLNGSDPADNEAAERYAQFNVGWWLSPLTTGEYPAVMRERVGDRLPTFTPEEAALVKGSYDLFMYNFYYADQITDCASASSNTSCSSLRAGWYADMGVDDSHMPADAVYSDGLGNCAGHFGYPPSYLEAIEWVHGHDTSANIMLTENGWCGNTTIDNQDQLWYFRTHLEQVHKAIYEKNIPIIGYLAWSFMDNYEWGSYAARYGLYYVDYPDNIGDADVYSVSETSLTRTPRSAAKFYSSVASTGCLEVDSDDLKWL